VTVTVTVTVKKFTAPMRKTGSDWKETETQRKSVGCMCVICDVRGTCSLIGVWRGGGCAAPVMVVMILASPSKNTESRGDVRNNSIYCGKAITTTTTTALYYTVLHCTALFIVNEINDSSLFLSLVCCCCCCCCGKGRYLYI